MDEYIPLNQDKRLAAMKRLLNTRETIKAAYPKDWRLRLEPHIERIRERMKRTGEQNEIKATMAICDEIGPQRISARLWMLAAVVELLEPTA